MRPGFLLTLIVPCYSYVTCHFKSFRTETIKYHHRYIAKTIKYHYRYIAKTIKYNDRYIYIYIYIKIDLRSCDGQKH